jgi:hypothetical protein
VDLSGLIMSYSDHRDYQVRHLSLHPALRWVHTRRNSGQQGEKWRLLSWGRDFLTSKAWQEWDDEDVGNENESMGGALLESMDGEDENDTTDTVERERETVATIALLAERGKVSGEVDVLATGME